MAALGDSMTRAYAVCGGFGDCPEASWATGDRGGLDSHAQRLGLEGDAARNLAVSGATVSDLPEQARRAVEARVDYVTVLIGANDACAPDEAAMTPVAGFGRDFDAAMDILARGLPEATVLVVSVPDLLRLWAVGKDDPQVLARWDAGVCQSMLADAGSEAEDARDRRDRVRRRVSDYNAAMDRSCRRHPRCRTDGGAVFAYDFSLGMVSELDYWHPSEEGQRTLAEVTWRAAGLW